jgi:hypothetical protein
MDTGWPSLYSRWTYAESKVSGLSMRKRTRALASTLRWCALGSSLVLACTGTEFCASGGYECAPQVSAGQGGAAGENAVASAGTAAGDDGGATTAGGASGTGGASGGAGDDGAAGDNGDAGSGATSGAAGSNGLPDDACNPASPADGCTLSDDTGIYVDPTSGDDRALGTREAPLASAAKALLIASDLGKPVYLCNAEFDEHLDATDAAVALRGGYTCRGDERGAWTYAAEERATVRATTPGVVLGVRGVSGFAVSDVDFYAADGVDTGASSVAAFVGASTGVTFRRVELRAGKGTDGVDAEFTPFTLPRPEELRGSGFGESPEVAKECACPAGDITLGGAAAENAGPGGSGEPIWEGENGGEPGVCSVSGNGGRGVDAPANPPGPGAQVLGALLTDGWHPAWGTDGEHGAPGQGGGGAAASPPTLGTSGGGCGGCGGHGGPGGGGGGGSIALLAFDSEVALRFVSLVAADAGHGGDGVAGQAGQAGGAAGTAQANYCVGGHGGTGADGGAGGGGAGGVSAAVLMSDSDVDFDSATTLAAGAAGDGGLGGVPGVNDGINGLSRSKLVLNAG